MARKDEIWKHLARQAAEINKSKGFYIAGGGSHLETVGIIALVGTELVEAYDVLCSKSGDESLSIELADASIRILSILNNLAGDMWVVRETAEYRVNEARRGPVSECFWNAVSLEKYALESERRGDTRGVVEWLEVMLRSVREIHKAYCPNESLIEDIRSKLKKNEERPYLHGKNA